MSFQSFAQQHGLIIDHLVYDKWTRVKTTDKLTPNQERGMKIRQMINDLSIHRESK